jgi:hypothetical protein
LFVSCSASELGCCMAQPLGYRTIEIPEPPPGVRMPFTFARVDHAQRIVWMWREVPMAWREHARAVAFAESVNDPCPEVVSLRPVPVVSIQA